VVLLSTRTSLTILFEMRQRADGYGDVTSINTAGAVVPPSDHVKFLMSHSSAADAGASCVASTFSHILSSSHRRRGQNTCMRLHCLTFGLRQLTTLYAHQSTGTKAECSELALSTSQFTSSRRMFHHLRWLPVECRVKFRIAKLAFCAPHSLTPEYHALFSTICRRVRCELTTLIN
jgi:hypothetical protein